MQKKTATPIGMAVRKSNDPSEASPRISQAASRRLMMAARRLLKGLYRRADDGKLTTGQRNYLITIRSAAGEHQSDLAREYGISPQRVWQIVSGRSH